MNTSNLAKRIDEFATLENEARAPAREAPRMFVVATFHTGRARRRLTLQTRRIQIRDSGLRPFRVY